jgi:hypothetical protein
MRQRCQAIEDAALAVMETYKALEGELEEKKASLTAMEKEFEKHKAVVAKARGAQVDVENELMVRLPSSPPAGCACGSPLQYLLHIAGRICLHAGW